MSEAETQYIKDHKQQASELWARKHWVWLIVCMYMNKYVCKYTIRSINSVITKLQTQHKLSQYPLRYWVGNNTGLSKKMDGIWNRYNLKSTGRIYTFGVLKCSEEFKVLDLP